MNLAIPALQSEHIPRQLFAAQMLSQLARSEFLTSCTSKLRHPILSISAHNEVLHTLEPVISVISKAGGISMEELEAMRSLIAKTDLSQRDIWCKIFQSSLESVSESILHSFIPGYLLSDPDFHFLSVLATTSFSQSFPVSESIFNYFFDLLQTPALK
jgi:hypothetical protein